MDQFAIILLNRPLHLSPDTICSWVNVINFNIYYLSNILNSLFIIYFILLKNKNETIHISLIISLIHYLFSIHIIIIIIKLKI